MSAGKKQITFEELQDGYNLYIANCSGCHSLHVPSSKTEKQWEIILPKMVLKAKLNIHEQELIRNYIYSKL